MFGSKKSDKIFLVAEDFGCKNTCWVELGLSPGRGETIRRQNVWLKKVWSKKKFGPKNIGSNKIVAPKHFGLKKVLNLKKSLFISF